MSISIDIEHNPTMCRIEVTAPCEGLSPRTLVSLGGAGCELAGGTGAVSYDKSTGNDRKSVRETVTDFYMRHGSVGVVAQDEHFSPYFLEQATSLTVEPKAVEVNDLQFEEVRDYVLGKRELPEDVDQEMLLIAVARGVRIKDLSEVNESTIAV